MEETGSTNADLLDAAAKGAPHRSVLLTHHQTAGRGRLDRTWEAPPGSNLLVSILVRDLPPHLHQVTQRAALAARAACRESAGVEVDLKWPNDLLLGGRKLAGVLAHAGVEGGQLRYVVVGLGLNIGWAPDGAARLGEVPSGAVPPERLLAALLTAWDELPADISEPYRNALATIGQRVRVTLPAGSDSFVGTAVGVEADGRLVVLDECGITRRIDAAEVVHVRPS